MYKTYIIKSNGIYKIGRSKNIPQRLISMSTDNPCEIELLKTYPIDIESYLHRVFDEYRIRNEWFNLPDNWESMIDEFQARVNSSLYKESKRLSALRVTDPNYIELRKKCLTFWKWKLIDYGFDTLIKSVYWREIVMNFPHGIKISHEGEIDEVPDEIQLIITTIKENDYKEIIIYNPLESDQTNEELY